MRRAAAIVGIGQTEFSKNIGRPERSVALEAIRSALQDAGLEPREVDGLVRFDMETTTEVEIARNLEPSARGELEITDVNLAYLADDSLRVEVLGRGTAWLDTGTHESLLQASNFIQTIQDRQGLKVACLEEIAFRQGYINQSQLEAAGTSMKNNSYGQYLLDLAREDLN